MKQYLRIRINFVFLWIIISLSCTSQSWEWSNQIGSTGRDRALGVGDKHGNFYLAGNYQNYQCYFPDTIIGNSSNSDGLFLAKFNNSGNMLWVTQITLCYPQTEMPAFGDIILDDNGFVYITGKFYSCARFDTIWLFSSGEGDIFIAKYTSEGTCVWAKSAGGPLNDMGEGLAVDSVYNVYVCGYNMDVANFDTVSLIDGGFMVKYNSSGELLWAKNQFKYNNPYYGSDLFYSSMTVYKDNLYASGFMMNDTVLIDTILVAHPLGIRGNIVSCYDLNAHIKWVAQSASPYSYSGNISTDQDGNIYVTGEFRDSIEFSGITLRNQGKHDALFCKYNPQGSLLWARQMHTTQNAYGQGIIPDFAGNCYTTGSFSGTVNFGNDSIFSDTDQDLFLSKYDGNGNFIGLTHFGKAEGLSLSVDSDNKPYVNGVFSGVVTIGQNVFTSHGDDDILLAKSDQIMGMKKIESNVKNRLIIFANPTTGKFNITIPDEFLHEKSVTLTIYDNQGKSIRSFPTIFSDNKIGLNLSTYAQGIYNAVLTNGKKSYSGRIMLTDH